MWFGALMPALGLLGALVLAALVPGLQAQAGAGASPCAELARHYNASLSRLGKRTVTWEGGEVQVQFVWDSEPSHAAAALLLVLLRHALRYNQLHLAPNSTNLATLASNYSQVPETWKDAVVGVSAAWEPRGRRRPGAAAGLAGARLSELGASGVPARRVLHARLVSTAPSATCNHCVRWTFYTNTTALQHCGFLDNLSSFQNEVAVYGVGESAALLPEVVRRASAAGVSLSSQTLDRATLAHYIRTANHSFLFIDYDFWKKVPNVFIAETPPCISVESVCEQELDTTIAIRVADVNMLQTYEPNLMQFVNDFNPSPESLRLILELKENDTNIEDAACAWAVEHRRDLKTWKLNTYDVNSYDMMVYYCEDDPYSADYDAVIGIAGLHAYKQTKKSNFNINVKRSSINCSDTYNLSSSIYKMTQYVDINRLVGVIAAGAAGAADAAALASRIRLPLLLLDAAPTGVASTLPVTWHVLGSLRHLARALQRFVSDSGWTRLAVLSQPTPLAAELYAEISDGASFAHHEYHIPMKSTLKDAKEYVRLLRTKARIIFVNADPETATVIMAAAIELQMSFAEGYVWILREWPVTAANTTVLTVSFWARGEQSLARAPWLRPVLNKLRKRFGDRDWPPRTLPLVDAVLTLNLGFRDMLLNYPNARRDLHSDRTMTELYESLDQKPIEGINHVLQYTEGVVEESFVFVDQWHGNTFSRLAAWLVNTRERSANVSGPYERPEHLPREDGASSCLARAGDDFDPDCYDAVWTTALLFLTLAPVTLVMYRRALRRRIARLLKARESELLARRQHVAAALAAYLVKREALELREELGAGHFGCVRLALLRLPNHCSRYVAAKALRENAAPAEESEFLREACTIASLDHEHVVRLVGVCITEGPPLVLMELAFFGDLLGYLRARRHLAEGAEFADQECFASFEEAAHVSSEALTRLAREAAAALAYLSSRGIVHRDVRAANCLIDARRSLKLADFGMAREIVAGADGAPEYACRRRGLFPVLWMAPESLAHGVFSAATDVWALGVLVLELVTLGARPYGSMSPLRVLEYVAAGGCPPLPLDATPQTCGVARLCWQRAAGRRPSAAEVLAYLAARPRALRPAAAAAHWDHPTDADSGLGVSPTTELLPPEFPLDSID
ncbi:unnamed protein product [Chrysodeixis includens]|uniref:Protein kinase domain-containing protein n=1 Tax=Chrysodeixis includens TaxID=689277 RepID=A0A9P0BY56_CHRIL|nr:unnamed protein product [Chrysodeixis includens]